MAAKEVLIKFNIDFTGFVLKDACFYTWLYKTELRQREFALTESKVIQYVLGNSILSLVLPYSSTIILGLA